MEGIFFFLTPLSCNSEVPLQRRWAAPSGGILIILIDLPYDLPWEVSDGHCGLAIVTGSGKHRKSRKWQVQSSTGRDGSDEPEDGEWRRVMGDARWLWLRCLGFAFGE